MQLKLTVNNMVYGELIFLLKHITKTLQNPRSIGEGLHSILSLFVSKEGCIHCIISCLNAHEQFPTFYEQLQATSDNLCIIHCSCRVHGAWACARFHTLSNKIRPINYVRSLSMHIVLPTFEAAFLTSFRKGVTCSNFQFRGRNQ